MDRRQTLIRRLLTRTYRGMSLGLSRMDKALSTLGDPDLSFDAVHIAGTNGKGSTAAMVESIARAAGLRTGLYTSPHLGRINERIRLDGEPVDDARLVAVAERVLDEGPSDLTFFETLTATAFEMFRVAEVELAVVEVGLGGRYDATNAMRRVVGSAITSIAMDHEALLGDTLPRIAGEKAGILRQGVPAVVGPLAPEAERVVLQEAQSVDCPVRWVNRDLRSGASSLSAALAVDGLQLTGFDGEQRHMMLSLSGAHQVNNAAVAAGLMLSIERPHPFEMDHVEKGLACARWPGRLEWIHTTGGTRVLLDCAHNPEGMQSLANYLASERLDGRRALVFGAVEDKRWQDGLEQLKAHFDHRFYAQPKGRPAASLDALANVAPGEGFVEGSDALRKACSAVGKEGWVLVTGSIYLVGELRSQVLDLDVDPVIAM